MNISKFFKWAEAGKRNVNIEIDSQDGNAPAVKIWCYDYTLSTGKSAGINDEPPTEQELKDVKRHRTYEEIGAMDGE